MRRLLVLRPEPGASATAARARKHGLDAVVVPLFEIEPVPWRLPDWRAFDALLLTSANAVRHAGAKLRRLNHLPVYAVGEATAAAARAAGFAISAVGDGGVDALLGSIGASVRLLHLCGEDRAPTLRQNIVAIAVYAAKPFHAPDLSGASGAVALIHSPRSGRRFAELVSDRASIAIAAISPAAAEAVGAGWAAVECASGPNDDALLALAARLCNNPAPQ